VAEFRPLDPFVSPRFGQIPTFMRLPHCRDPQALEAPGLVRALRGLAIVGFDLVEVSPSYDGPGQITAFLGANLLFEFVSLLALHS